MEAGHPPPEEQVAEKPDLENGGSCNSGDEGIDTTEPVDDIEPSEPVGDIKPGEPVGPVDDIEPDNEPVGKTEEIDNSGSDDEIEENGSSIPDNEEEPIGEIADDKKEEVVMEETVESEKEEKEATEEQEDTVEETKPLIEEQESEKSSREILLEKRCSLSHTPDIGRVLDKEAAKASVKEVHEFQKVKSELKKAGDEQQQVVAELKISQTHEDVGEETGRSENHFLQSDVTKSEFEEVTTDTPEEEKEEEVAETIIELTLAPSPMIMDLTPAPVQIVKDSKVTEKNKGGKNVGEKRGGKSASKQTKEVLAKNEKNALGGKNKKGKKEDTEKKKTNGEVKGKAPDIIKDAVPTNGHAGKAGSPTRKVVGGKENQGDAKQASSKTRIRERTLERDDMLGTKKGDAAQKKVSVGSAKDQVEVVVESGGLMRPTKAWLNHLGDQQQQQGNPAPPRSPSPRRRPSRSSAQSSKPPPGMAEAEAGPRRSSSLRSKTPKPDGRRASSATGSKNAGVEASNENGGEAVRAKSPRKKKSKSPPPVPPKPSGGSEEGVVEETISAGEAIIKFEAESATFAAVSGQETAANCKEEKGEGTSTMSKESDIESRKKTDASQEKGIETTENATGTVAVNGKTSRSSRTSQGSKSRSVSVSSSRKSAKGSASGGAESSKEGVEATVSKKSSVVSGGGEGGLMRPTKSWLNHLGEQAAAGGKVPSTQPTLNGTGTIADEGPAAMRKNSSQKTIPDSASSSSVSSSSSGDKMLTSSTSSSSSDSSSSGKSKALKEKIVAANNNKAASNLVNGKEICQNGTVQGKEKDPAVTINGGIENAERPVNGKEGGRTTMMIRLHPGRTNKLSAYLENQEKPGSRTWLTEALTEEVEDALCGLEISFSSVPQDIDIKLLPPSQGDEHLEDGEK